MKIKLSLIIILFLTLLSCFPGKNKENTGKETKNEENQYSMVILKIPAQKQDAIEKTLLNDLPEWDIKLNNATNEIHLKSGKKSKDKNTQLKQINNLIEYIKNNPDISENSLIRGIRIKNIKNSFAFPTGKICIVFNDEISLNERKKILSEYKDVFYYKDIIPDYSKVKEDDPGGNEVPEYVKWAEKKGKTFKLNKSKIIKKKSISIPKAIITLPEELISQSFEIAYKLKQIKTIKYAIPDIDIYSEEPVNTGVHQTNTSLPYLTDENTLDNNYVHRAWEFFIPGSLPGETENNQFICTNTNVALIDYNFFDHDYINQSFIGIDAVDEDRDPRSPDYPYFPDHGMMMAGIIGGYKQEGSDEPGVAPGAVIIPLRPIAINYDDYNWVRDFFLRWWFALNRLYILSLTDSVAITNFSGNINKYILEDDVNQSLIQDFENAFDEIINQGNFGNGIFFTCSAGNEYYDSTITYPASKPSTFAVTLGNFESSENLANYGENLDIIVDNGYFPNYRKNNVVSINRNNSNFGSSGASALVAGVAAMMKAQGLNAREIKEALRYSTRIKTGQARQMNELGYCDRYGYGFLDAFYAVKIAYKDQMQPVNAVKINYKSTNKPILLIQASLPAYYPEYGGKPSGIFWALEQKEDRDENYWHHFRENRTHHGEIIIDSISVMGDIMVTGNFDGLIGDEIALQMGYWIDRPENSFVIKKYNSTTKYWNSLGQSDVYPGIQLTWPGITSVNKVVALKLTSEDKQQLVARQGNKINIAEYNRQNNRWELIGTRNYEPLFVPVNISSLFNESSYQSHLIDIIPGYFISGLQSLIIISQIDVLQSEYEQYPAGRYTTLSIIRFNNQTLTWENVLFQQDRSMHILLDYTGNLDNKVYPQTIVAKFNRATNDLPEIVIKISKNNTSTDKLILLDFSCQYQNSRLITSYEKYIYQFEIDKNIHAGDVDNNRKSEIIYLNNEGSKSIVHFLIWNSENNRWDRDIEPFEYERKGNRGIDLLAGDFNEDGYCEFGILMEKPHANIYHVFQMSSGSFWNYGVW